MENKLKFDFIKMFTQTKNMDEIFTGKVEENKLDYRVLFRCCRNESKLNFLLYDFKDIYFSQTDFPEVFKLNKKLNTSLEFSDIHSLLNFVFENIIKKEKDLSITKNVDKFEFEVLVDIVKVKWIFECQRIKLEDSVEVYEIIQDLFVKPLINVLLSLQNFITTERPSGNCIINSTIKSEVNINDVKAVVDNLEVNKRRNFNKYLALLTSESTNKIFSSKIAINKSANIESQVKVKANDDNHRSDNSRQNAANSLKRKYNQTELDKEKEKSHTQKNTTNFKNKSEKSSELSNDDFYIVTDTFNTGSEILAHKSKPEKKKKQKLKFV
jgi:hypothetical protein